MAKVKRAFEMKVLVILFMFALVFSANASVFGAEKEVHFDFETGNQDWIIPDWAYYQSDHVARDVSVSDKEFSSGSQSLEIMCEYPGDNWRSALVEREKNLDLTGYKKISVDIYIPKKAPRGMFLGRIILTVGDGWHFTQMKEGVPLPRGKWTTIEVDLDNEGYTFMTSPWRGRDEKRLYKHLGKVKKVAVRIEYDAAPPYRIGPKYHGPIYIDNMIIK